MKQKNDVLFSPEEIRLALESSDSIIQEKMFQWLALQEIKGQKKIECMSIFHKPSGGMNKLLPRLSDDLKAKFWKLVKKQGSTKEAREMIINLYDYLEPQGVYGKPYALKVIEGYCKKTSIDKEALIRSLLATSSLELWKLARQEMERYLGSSETRKKFYFFDAAFYGCNHYPELWPEAVYLIEDFGMQVVTQFSRPAAELLRLCGQHPEIYPLAEQALLNIYRPQLLISDFLTVKKRLRKLLLEESAFNGYPLLQLKLVNLLFERKDIAELISEIMGEVLEICDNAMAFNHALTISESSMTLLKILRIDDQKAFVKTAEIIYTQATNRLEKLSDWNPEVKQAKRPFSDKTAPLLTVILSAGCKVYHPYRFYSVPPNGWFSYALYWYLWSEGCSYTIWKREIINSLKLGRASVETVCRCLWIYEAAAGKPEIREWLDPYFHKLIDENLLNENDCWYIAKETSNFPTESQAYWFVKRVSKDQNEKQRQLLLIQKKLRAFFP